MIHHKSNFLSIFQNLLIKKKFSFSFCRDFKKKCDIGIYAHDADKIKDINSKLSIISLGGMDQGKLLWPNFWVKENWNKFDFGILPGNNWANMWKQTSWYKGARPKIAMLLTGWPKSIELKNIQKKKRRKKIILYAPCFETDNKQLDVAYAVKKTNFNLLIKHLPWDTNEEILKFRDVKNNIKIANKLTKKILGNRVKILNSKSNIMKYYSKVDLLITDESSVMYESLLYDLPNLSCKDWPIRTNNVNIPRMIKTDSSVCTYTIKSNLEKSIKHFFQNKSYFKKIIKLKKKNHFSYIHSSTLNINNFLIKYTKDKKILFEIKPRFEKNYLKSFLIDLKYYFLNKYYLKFFL